MAYRFVCDKIQLIMETVQPDILLVNIPARLFYESDRYAVAVCGRPAPLGLYCLAAVDTDRIAVIDGTSISSLIEALAGQQTSRVFSLIFQIADNIPAGKLQTVIERIRRIFPAACLGAGSKAAEIDALFDFAFNGTGKTLILRILRGERLRGFYDSFKADMATEIGVPGSPLVESVSEIAPEKWLGGQTVEIRQPWLGFLDQSVPVVSYPGIHWLNELILWLKGSGYKGFHFRASGLQFDHLHELRSVMLNHNVNFSVSFKVENFSEFSLIGSPLKEIWIEGIDNGNGAMAVEIISKIQAHGCRAGILLDRAWVTVNEKTLLVNSADRMVVSDVSDWNFADLKYLISKFWGARKRFFVRLFSIKRAAELIMFMKTSYAVLDILFTSEKNGR